MKKLIVWSIIILIILGGIIIYKNHYSSDNKISEDQAAQLATSALVHDRINNSLKEECISSSISQKNSSAIIFDLHEIHNSVCGGDGSTSPRISQVLVNLNTGEVYDQDVTAESTHIKEEAVVIDGKEYVFTKKLK